MARPFDYIQKIITGINSVGIREDHSVREKNTIYKVNVLASTGELNVITGIFITLYLGVQYIPFVLVSFAVFFFIYYFLLTKINYVVSSVFIVIYGFFLSFVLSLFLGIKSGSFLLFFPLLFSSFQIFSTKETIRYLSVICISAMGLMVLMMYIAARQAPFLQISPSMENLLFSIFCVYSVLICIQFNYILAKTNLQTETKLNKLISEKELILSEMFHRVKNNLNVIISMLNLKKHSTEDESTRTVLEEIKERIYAMAMIHEKIFTNKQELALNMQNYIFELCQYIAEAYGRDNFQFNISAKEVLLDIHKAMPCGMIINELITNSFKHSDKEKKLMIDIDFMLEGNAIRLVYKDNGPGISQDIVAHSNSLGMILIEALTDQLEGRKTVGSNTGYYFQLEFLK